MIRKVISEKDENNKPGWTYDKKSKVWFTWEVDITERGKRIRQRGFSTERKAIDFADDLKLKRKLKTYGVHQPDKMPAVDEALNRHLQTITHPQLNKWAKRVYEAFLSVVPEGLNLSELKKSHFRDYADKRFADERKDKRASMQISPSTVKRELKFVSAALHAADEYFPACENWRPPKMYSPPVPKDEKARIIEADEWKRIVDYLLRDREAREHSDKYRARRRVGLTFHFGLLTGLRHGEICALKKEHFDLEKRRLKAERMKTKKSGIRWTVFEPLTDLHIGILNEAAQLYPETSYFFSHKGIIHGANYKVLEAAAAHLKIPYGKFVDGGFVFHSTRHTFATTLLHNGVDDATARSLTAHTSNDMLMVYAHSTDKSKKRALEIASENFSSEKQNEKLTLKEIYDKIQSNEMEYSEFEKYMSRNSAAI